MPLDQKDSEKKFSKWSCSQVECSFDKFVFSFLSSIRNNVARNPHHKKTGKITPKNPLEVHQGTQDAVLTTV